MEQSACLPALAPQQPAVHRDLVPRNVFPRGGAFLGPLWQLLLRHSRHAIRDLRTLLTRLVVTVLLGVLVGTFALSFLLVELVRP